MSKQVKVIIEKDGKYLLIKREDEEKIDHKGNWESAGGKLEPNESFEEAAIREAKEETNLDVQIIKRVKEIIRNGETEAVVFLANPVSNDVKISNEHSDFKWFKYEELKKLDKITYKEFFLELIELSRR